MKARFLLKAPQTDSEDKQPTGIYLVCRIKDLRFVYSTGEKIHPDFWNPKEQRAVRRKGRSDLSTLNDYLDKLEVSIKAVIRKIKADGLPLAKDIIRDDLEIELGKKSKTISYTLASFGQEIADRKKRTGKYHKSIQVTVNILNKFRKNIPFEDVNMLFYNDFLEHLNKKEYSKNYIGKMLGNVKQIMNEALSEGLTDNIAHTSVKFKRMKEDVYNIYLSTKELEKLHKHDFSQTPQLDNACDLFLIGSFTGLRFGDYSQLSSVNFDGGDFVVQDTMKVDGRIIIPQHWIVKEILAKRDGKLPHTISNQKFNDYLKIIGKKAKIKQKIIKSRTKGSVKKRNTYFKYQLMTSHTARRSLATNMYLAGIPIKTIMKLTGHKTITQLMDYIKVTEQEIAESLVGHTFFEK